MYDLLRQSPQVSRETLAFILINQLRDLVDTACPEELTYLAWRLTQVTNDVCFAASAAGAAQRLRLAQADLGTRLLSVAA